MASRGRRSRGTVEAGEAGYIVEQGEVGESGEAGEAGETGVQEKQEKQETTGQEKGGLRVSLAGRWALCTSCLACVLQQGDRGSIGRGVGGVRSRGQGVEEVSR